jgi:hypothetical protein
MKKIIFISMGMFFLLTGISRAQVKIEGLKFGTGIENNDITGEAASFPAATEKVYCWLKVTGAEGQTIKVKWYHNGEFMNDVDLDIKYASMRTYAYKTIYSNTGDWKVEVLSAAGEVLQAATFKVE